MFAPAFSRAVRSTCASAGCTAASAPRSSLAVAAASTPFRRIHHRRPSSSKASCPPDGSQPPASAGQPTDKITEKIVKGAANAVKKSSSRSSKRKAAAPQSNVPYVPPTDHLAEKDVVLSSFFSLHRPIPIEKGNNALYNTYTDDFFNAIFQAPAQEKSNSFSNTIYTIRGAIKSLESGSRQDDRTKLQDMREELIEHAQSRGGNVIHLDGAPLPPSVIDELQSQFRPFRTPPAPVSFDPSQEKVERRGKGGVKVVGGKKKSDVEVIARRSAKRKWVTKVEVTEFFDPNGSPAFSVASTPIVEVPSRPAKIQDPSTSAPVVIRQPFIRRMLERQQRWEESVDERADQKGTMMLISVKRQRKLKMKKHKYKKLMKRTRNLRRKLDRA